MELQTAGATQSPQWTLPPQALGRSPQLAPAVMHSTGCSSGWHLFCSPCAAQPNPAGQEGPVAGHWTWPPQPSLMKPHSMPRLVSASAQIWAGVPGVQIGSQMLKNGLQVWLASQLPHSTVLVVGPQPR